MLLPTFYHDAESLHDQFGGLAGELPIFIELIASQRYPKILHLLCPE
jgi:hypothetical protein